MDKAMLGRLHSAWNKLDTASRRIAITPAGELSDAVARLEAARLEMDSVIQDTYSLAQ